MFGGQNDGMGKRSRDCSDGYWCLCDLLDKQSEELMGLDMFLYRVRTTDVLDTTKHSKKDKTPAKFLEGDALREKFGHLFYAGTVGDAHYWRKFNALHNWFVKKVQDGVDECQIGKPVTLEMLQELHDKLHKVIDVFTDAIACGNTVGRIPQEDDMGYEEWGIKKGSKHEKQLKSLFPTAEGFFFGNTSYGRDYLNDVTETYDWLTQFLGNKSELDGYTLFYHSSW